MESLTLTATEAKQLYCISSEDGKKMLEEKFGKELFSNSEYKELFAVFCKEENLIITHDEPESRLKKGYIYIPHAEPADGAAEHDNASRMIRAIIANNNKKLNFIPDYDNENQKRWFPILKKTKAGFVFSYTLYEGWASGTFAFVGSPFVSPSSSEAERLCRKYLPIYIKLLQ